MNLAVNPEAVIDWPGILRCPLCRGPLDPQGNETIECRPCRRAYPAHGGVYDLRLDPLRTPIIGTADTAAPVAGEAGGSERARAMRRNRLELHILTHMLSGQSASRVLLDVSCRRGRFAGPMQSATRLLIEADSEPESARAALDAALNPPRVAALTCDPDRLPFASESLDGVVCIRLSHHIDNPSTRESVLTEALRVAARFVVFSFSEPVSIPILWRKLRRRIDTFNPMPMREVRSVAERFDAGIAESVTVSPLGSRHRFVLLRKQGPH